MTKKSNRIKVQWWTNQNRLNPVTDNSKQINSSDEQIKKIKLACKHEQIKTVLSTMTNKSKQIKSSDEQIKTD